MDEELDRSAGGAAVAHGGAPLSFSGTQGSTGYSPGNVAGAVGAAGVVAQPAAAAWGRKRDRPDRGGVSSGQGMTDVSWVREVSGGVVVLPTMGRESPDSDMSSGSDVSINRGIKRMRIDQRLERQQQQQRPVQHQQQQQQLHQQQPLSAFDRFGGGSGSGRQPAPQQPWGGGASAAGIRHLSGTLPGRQPNAGDNTAGSFAAINPSPMATPAPTAARTILHHPRPLLDRSVSDRLGLPSANPTHLAKNATGGGLQAGADGGGARNGPPVVRSSSFDCCVAFPPFAPQPPAQARYVRGIRVEADAPSDVDYSNVNNALRQLHMERRMVAAARGGGGGAGWGGRPPA